MRMIDIIQGPYAVFWTYSLSKLFVVAGSGHTSKRPRKSSEINLLQLTRKSAFNCRNHGLLVPLTFYVELHDAKLQT